MSEKWIWISRWEDFQHYKPERDRAPAWIKHYTKQLDDDRYLQLTDRQRALLVDLRCMFAASRMRTRYDQHAITMRRRMRTYSADLDALNHAGFIEILSRVGLDRRLEELYSSRAPARSQEKEVEVERKKALGVTLGDNGSTPDFKIPVLKSIDEVIAP